jgi:hypothetical protein
MMKLTEFTYTKENGDVSERALLVTQQPRTNIAGFDVTKMPESDFAAFITEYETLTERHMAELAEVTAKYDLTHNYRQFIPARMSEVTTEQI